MLLSIVAAISTVKEQCICLHDQAGLDEATIAMVSFSPAGMNRTSRGISAATGKRDLD